MTAARRLDLLGLGYLLARARRPTQRALDLALAGSAAAIWFAAASWLLALASLVRPSQDEPLIEAPAHRLVSPGVAAALTVAGASLAAVWLVRRVSRPEASGPGPEPGPGP